MQNSKLKTKKQSTSIMNITSSTQDILNGSLDISSFLPTTEDEALVQDLSIPNVTSKHLDNALPDLFSDFDFSLPDFSSSNKEINDIDFDFPDFDLDLSTFANSSKDAKNVSTTQFNNCLHIIKCNLLAYDIQALIFKKYSIYRLLVTHTEKKK